jgi:hypothetical protein
MKFQTGFVRVYYNRGGDPAKLWSVDFGPGTPEILCRKVHVHGVMDTAAACPLPENPKEQPSAWMEARTATVILHFDGSVNIEA